MNDQQNNIQLPEEEGIDIKKYIFLILSHWWWFAITLFISVTIAYMVNRYSQEIYSANSSIIIGEPESGAGSVESILDEFTRVRGKKRKAVVENEISILKSYKLARLALDELDFNVEYIGVGRRGIAETRLYHMCPFHVVIDSINPAQVGFPISVRILNEKEYLLTIEEPYSINEKVKFGERFVLNSLIFRVYLSNPEDYQSNYWSSNVIYFKAYDVNNLVKQFRNSLNVEVNAEKGSILSMSMSGFVPQQITNYLNKLSEVYIRANLEEKNLASENTIQFIDEQLRGVIDSLEITGLRLQQFRSANKVINLSREGTFLFDKMQSLQSEKAILDISSRYYLYLQKYINEKTDFSDVIAPSIIGVADPLLNSLVATLNNLNLERRNLNLSVMENSPQVIIVNNQIENTRNALEENLKSLITANGISMVELNQRIGKIEKEVQKLPGTERQMINIEREFTINDQIYTFLLEKRAEAGITKASNTSDHKILDIARPENASLIKPKASTNYMMAIAAGGAIPLALLLLLDFFNTKITDRKFIENNLKAPVLGNIGHNDDGSELPVNENPRSSLSESFRALRTNLQYILKEQDAKVIAVSSAVSGEGKTFCSVNIASILAIAGKKTLIVSLDLRRPKVHKVFNLENKQGMSTYLIHKNSFEEIMSETNINDLYVATSGPIPPNPAELLGSDRMREFIKEARKKFDYVILDTPPIAIVTDTLTLKDLLDAFIFVIRHNYSDKQVIDLANGIYEKHLIKNMGVIINDIQVKGYDGYSYRYGYSYSYRYAYYDEKVKKMGIKELIKKYFT